MYSKIDARFWDDEKVLAMTPDARYLTLYLLTTKHRNIIGCYPLPRAYAQEDINLPDRGFKRAWEEVLASGMACYDDTTKIILVRNFLRYNPIENPSQAKGAIARLETMPRCPLYAEVIKTLHASGKEYLQEIIDWLYRKLPNGCDPPPQKPSGTSFMAVCPTPSVAPCATLSPAQSQTPSPTPSAASCGTPTLTPDNSIQITDNSKQVRDTPPLPPIGGQTPENPAPRQRKRPEQPGKGTVQFAEFVSMTNDEYTSLVAKYGEHGALRCVEILDNYKGASGKKYRSDYRAILNWVTKRYEEERAKGRVLATPATSGNPFLDLVQKEERYGA